MKYITLMLLTTFLVALVMPISAGEGDYALPEPDYRPEITSEACFSGTITQVAEGKISASGVNSDGKKESLEIVIEPQTSIFTVMGGHVSPDQLQKGIKLKVWFKGEGCNKLLQPITGARIIIASKDPDDDWP